MNSTPRRRRAELPVAAVTPDGPRGLPVSPTRLGASLGGASALLGAAVAKFGAASDALLSGVAGNLTASRDATARDDDLVHAVATAAVATTPEATIKAVCERSARNRDVAGRTARQGVGVLALVVVFLGVVALLYAIYVDPKRGGVYDAAFAVADGDDDGCLSGDELLAFEAKEFGPKDGRRSMGACASVHKACVRKSDMDAYVSCRGL